MVHKSNLGDAAVACEARCDKTVHEAVSARTASSGSQLRHGYAKCSNGDRIQCRNWWVREGLAVDHRYDVVPGNAAMVH